MAHPAKTQKQYQAPKITVMNETEVLEAFQIATAGVTGWWTQ